MTRVDQAIWQASPAGGVGPAGWLGAAAVEPAHTFYAPLHDYHSTPPDLSPAIAARCQLFEGRQAILAGTSIAQQTNVLTSSGLVKVVPDGKWFAWVGRTPAPESVEAMIALYYVHFRDKRLAVGEFWWASAAGREDQELNEAVGFLSAHTLATRGCVGVITSTDDEALISQYTVDQPIVRMPWDMLNDLGLQSMVGP